MYTKQTLPNGVRLISEHIPYVRTASLGIWIGNGSRYEPASLGGISHFIEHMIFKGTEKRSAQHLAIAMDALGGQFNAFTDKECTCYYMKVLDKRLQTGASILADMFLSARFDQKDLELERGVVLEEIDMYEDSPEDVATEQLGERCFAGSELGRPILGTADTLEAMDAGDLHAYVRDFYHPADTVISLSGSFSDADLAYLAELFSAMPGQGHNRITPAAYQRATLLRKKDIEQNHLCLTFPSVSLLSEERYTASLLGAILGGGMSSRLFQTVREQHGLCYSIYSFASAFLDTGLLSIYTGVGTDAEEQALRLIAEELRRFCADGPTADELARCREQAKTTLLMSLESTSGRMMSLGKSELMRGKIDSIDTTLAHYDAVTAEQLLTLARHTFDFEQASLAVVGTPQSEEFYRNLLH